MTLLLIGVCHDGTVIRSGRYKHPVTGRMETGVYREPCPACEGRGCPPPPTAPTVHTAVREALTD